MLRRAITIALLVAVAAMTAVWLAAEDKGWQDKGWQDKGSQKKGWQDEAAARSEPRGGVPGPPERPERLPSGEDPRALPHQDVRALRVPAGVGLVALGGGSDPQSTQVSLEQDVALLSRTLAGRGLVLFASGGRGLDVQYEAPAPPTSSLGDRLRARLGELFDPRPRDVAYRRAEIKSDGPADFSTLAAALSGALGQPLREPLLVYVAAHGESGENPVDAVVGLWGGDVLQPPDLAHYFDAARRPVRFVIASCFSGGFAEALFRNADSTHAEIGEDRCGFFSTSWDREASGCDPNPDRRTQEGYTLHFLNALVGRARSGDALPREEIDLDHDGAISMREAHAHVVATSRSIDLPLTTSSWYLARATLPATESALGRVSTEKVSLPEEAYVIERLGARLGIRRETEALALLSDLEETLTRLDARLEDAERAHDAAYRELRLGLLAQHPFVDDPYHPSHDDLIAEHGGQIEALLDRSPAAKRYRERSREVEGLTDELTALEVDWSAARRLTDAYRVQREAAWLARHDRARFEAYRKLVACERWIPPTL